MQNLYAVIMAGGKGTRFWPRSRAKYPKQFLNIVGQKSMLQQTIDRIQPLIDLKKIFIVTAQDQVEQTKQQLPELSPDNILVEPLGKNTAPCIGLAAVYISQIEPDSIMCALPADHYLEKEAEFRAILSKAIEFLQDDDYLITLGIQPTRPETGYGYIEIGDELATLGDKKIFRANRFLEKPELALAKELVACGQYLWNSGMFIWRTSSILREIQQYLPNLYHGLQEISSALNTSREPEVIGRVYANLDAISIDKGVMEKADKIAVIPCQLGWNDVGSWTSLYDLLPTDTSGNIIIGKHISIDSYGCLIISPDKLVATIGLKDIIVIDTEDALLICPKDQGQRVRDLIEELKKKGLEQYL
jgi:mannose-1-phosphate guanylyltransferase